MTALGLIPEPPFDPISWSGSSMPLFSALRRAGVLTDAKHVKVAELPQKLQSFSLPIERWQARYHASVSRFKALTRAAGEIIEQSSATAVLQIGAWFSSGSVTDKPCYSYHDGNAAQWYRHYGRGLLTETERQRHLDWERSVYDRMTRIFVMSEWLARSFVQDFGMPREKLHIVGAGINMAFPEAVERDFSRPTFLLVGRDFERKGGRYLLDAFRQVRREIDAQLVIVGPDAGAAEEGVRWEGYLSKSNPGDAVRLQRLFSEATCLVLPSIYEPFGISLCEGMAWGLPCVTVARCAMQEIVRDGETGIVVRPDDAADLARGMLRIAGDPVLACAYGIAGRERARREFTWDAVARKIADVI